MKVEGTTYSKIPSIFNHMVRNSSTIESNYHELQRFLESGIRLVECPDCACTRTLEPRGGVLRFKSHDKRKTTTPNTGKRWAKIDSDWDVVGGKASQHIQTNADTFQV